MTDVVLPVPNEVAALPWVLGRIPAHFTPIAVECGSTDGAGVRDLGSALAQT